MTRPIARAVLLAVVLAPVGGCDNEVIESSAMGVDATVGPVLLRSVHVAAPRDSRYPAGADARLWFTVLNEAQQPDTLTGLTSPVASRVQMRWDSDCDNQYTTVTRLPLAPLRPAPRVTGQAGVPPFDAYHAELIGLTREVLAGTHVEVTFAFTRAGEVTVSAPVLPSDAPRAEPSVRCVPGTSPPGTPTAASSPTATTGAGTSR